MRQKSGTGKAPAEQVIKDIRRGDPQAVWGPDERWSLDFVSNQLSDGARLCVLAVVHDSTRARQQSSHWLCRHQLDHAGRARCPARHAAGRGGTLGHDIARGARLPRLARDRQTRRATHRNGDQAAIRHNYSVQFVTAATLVATLAKAHGDGRLDEQLTIYARPKLLIIDELGYLLFELEPDAAHLFFQLVGRRYERGSMLVTSNRSVVEWGTVFGDPVVATAILDRLLHHCSVITIRGDSYGLREKRRAGLLQKAGTAHEQQTENVNQ